MKLSVRSLGGCRGTHVLSYHAAMFPVLHCFQRREKRKAKEVTYRGALKKLAPPHSG